MKDDTAPTIPDDIALLIISLTDENVMKVIRNSCNSPQGGLSTNEALDALGDVEGARRHLGQLMLEEICRQVQDDSSNSSEDSVIISRKKRIQAQNRCIHEQRNRVSPADLERVAAGVGSDLDRVCILI